MELNGYSMIFPNFLLGLYGDVRLAPLAHVRIKWGKNSSRLQYFDFSRAMEDGYGYIFETMLLTIAVLLLSSCWLLASTRALAGRKTLRDAAVQCDFSTALYVAPKQHSLAYGSFLLAFDNCKENLWAYSMADVLQRHQGHFHWLGWMKLEKYWCGVKAI